MKYEQMVSIYGTIIVEAKGKEEGTKLIRAELERLKFCGLKIYSDICESECHILVGDYERESDVKLQEEK